MNGRSCRNGRKSDDDASFTMCVDALLEIDPSSPQASGAILGLLRKNSGAFEIRYWGVNSVATGWRWTLLAATGNQDETTFLTSDSPKLAQGSPLVLQKADAPFASLAGESAQSIITLSREIRGYDFGVLCLEYELPNPSLDDERRILLKLAVERIEACFHNKVNAMEARHRQHEVSLDQSHLALTDGALRDLFFLAPTALVLSDPETARPIAANQHALSLLGLSTQRTDVRTTDFWHEHDERERFIQAVKEQGVVRGQRVRLRKTNGTSFWARISARILEYEGRTAIINNITDVSEVVAAEEVLHRTQQTLRTLLEASPFPLVVTRLDTGEVRYCNQKAADMFETPLSGLLGHTAPEFYVNPADRHYFVEKLRATGRVEGFVAKLKTQSGQPFWAMLSAKTLDLNGEPVFMVAFADVSKQKAKEQELELLAFKDSLTEAFNRRYFIEAARIELARAERHPRSTCLVLIDIDHFKNLNDTYGHEAGDDVLREFVGVVHGMLRRTDILARYGGEEFAILLPETNADAAAEIMERIRSAIEQHQFNANGTTASVTFSAGIVVPKLGEDYQSAIMRADDALYAAKHAGRNRIETSRD